MPKGNTTQIFQIIAELKSQGVEKFSAQMSKTLDTVGKLADSIKGFGAASAAAMGVSNKEFQGFLDSTRASQSRVKELRQELSGLRKAAGVSLGPAIKQYEMLGKVSRSLGRIISGLRDGEFRTFREELGVNLARALAAASTQFDSTIAGARNFRTVMEGLGPVSRSLADYFSTLRDNTRGLGEEALTASRHLRDGFVRQLNLQGQVAEFQKMHGALIDVSGTLSVLQRDMAKFSGNRKELEQYILAWNRKREALAAVNQVLEVNQNLQRQIRAAQLAPTVTVRLVRSMNLSLEEQNRVYQELSRSIAGKNLTEEQALIIGRRIVETTRSEASAQERLKAELKDVTAERQRAEAVERARTYMADQASKAAATRRVTAAVTEQAAKMGVLNSRSIDLQRITRTLITDVQKHTLNQRQLTEAIREQIRVQQNLATVPGRQQGSMISNIGQIFLLDQMAKRLTRSLSAAGQAFAQFEQGLAQVRKTANASIEATRALGENILVIGQEVPIVATDLAEIAGILGQVGAISFDAATQSVAEFAEEATKAIELVGQITLATDLGAEEAAKSYGRLRAIFRTDIARIRGELTSLTGVAADTTDALRTIVGSFNEIANSTTATVGEINQFIRAFGGVATNVGITAEQVAGLSGTLADLGVMQRVAGTALSRLFADMGKKAEVFADTLEISIGEFQERLDTDAFQTLIDFLTKLNQASARRRESILEGLGAEQRFRNTLLKLSEGVDLLERNVRTASGTLQNFRSIGDEADKFAETFSANLNRLKNGAIAVANAFEPFFAVIGQIAAVVGDVLTTVSNFIRSLGFVGTALISLAGAGVVILGLTTSIAVFKQSLALLTAQSAETMNTWQSLVDLFRRNIALAVPALRTTASEASKVTQEFNKTGVAAGNASRAIQKGSQAAYLGIASNHGQIRNQLRATRQALASYASDMSVVERRKISLSLAMANLRREFGLLAPNLTRAGKAMAVLSKSMRPLLGLSTAAIGLTTFTSGLQELASGNILAGITNLAVSVGSLTFGISQLAASWGKIKAVAIAAGKALLFVVSAIGAIKAAIGVAVVGLGVLAYWLATYESLMERNAEFAERMFAAAHVESFRRIATAAGVAEEQIEDAMDKITKGVTTAEHAMRRLRMAMREAAQSGEEIKFSLFAPTEAEVRQQAESFRRSIEIATGDLEAGELGIRGITEAETERLLAIEKERITLDEIARVSAAIVNTAEKDSKKRAELQRTVEELGRDFESLLEMAERMNVETGYTADQINETQRATLLLNASTRLVEESLNRRASTLRQIEEITRSLAEEEKELADIVEEVNKGRNRSLKDIADIQAQLEESLDELSDKEKESLERLKAQLDAKRQLRHETLATIRPLERQMAHLEKGSEEYEAMRNNVNRLRGQVSQLELQLSQGEDDLKNHSRLWRLLGESGRNALTTLIIEQNKLTESLEDQADAALRKNYAEGLQTLVDMRRKSLENELELQEDYSKRFLLLQMDLESKIDELNKKGVVNADQRLEIKRRLEEEYTHEVTKLHLEMLDNISSAAESELEKQIKAQEEAVQELDRALSSITESEETNILRQVQAQERVVERLRSRIERDSAKSQAELQRELSRLLSELEVESPFEDIEKAGEKVAETMAKVGDALLLTQQNYRRLTEEVDRAASNVFMTDSPERALSNLIRLENELAEASGQRLEVFKRGMDAVRDGAVEAGRATGRLVEAQQDLQDQLNQNADTAKGRYAKSFLDAFRRIVTDRSLTQFQRGIMMERAIAQFRRQFSEMEGEGPDMSAVLAVAEQLAQSEDGRLKTARDLRREAEAQTTSMLDQFDLTKRERAEAERLLKLREQAESAVGRAREGSSVEAVRQRRLEGIDLKLQEMLGPEFERLSRQMDGTADAGAELEDAEKELARLREMQASQVEDLTGKLGNANEALEGLKERLDEVRRSTEESREAITSAESLDQFAAIREGWTEAFRAQGEGLREFGLHNVEALQTTVDQIKDRFENLNLAGSIESMLRSLLPEDQEKEWKTLMAAGKELNTSIVTNMKQLTTSHAHTTAELQRLLRERKIEEQLPPP